MDVLKVKDIVLQPGRPKVVVPIVGNTPEKIIEECEKAAKLPCHIIEWRADYYLETIPQLDKALCSKELYLNMVKMMDDISYIAGSKPVIFTIRHRWQGGQAALTRQQDDCIWSLVAQAKLADFIDVELMDENGRYDERSMREQIERLHSHGCKVILSHHDFDKTPEPVDIVNVLSIMKKLGADICKMAVMAHSKADAEKLLKATAFLNNKGVGPLATMAMGQWGKATRVAAGRYGSCLTFASAGQLSAPGQMDIFTMNQWLDEYYGKE